MGHRDLDSRVRVVCMALPGVTEKLSHGTPAFSAGKQFLMLWPDGHHDHHFAHLWCAAAPGAQEALVEREPERYFRPPYVGTRGWIGVRLDVPIDDDDLQAVVEDAFRAVASDKLLRLLDDGG